MAKVNGAAQMTVDRNVIPRAVKPNPLRWHIGMWRGLLDRFHWEILDWWEDYTEARRP